MSITIEEFEIKLKQILGVPFVMEARGISSSQEEITILLKSTNNSTKFGIQSSKILSHCIRNSWQECFDVILKNINKINFMS